MESVFGHARDDLVGMAVGELFFDPDEGEAGDELRRYVADPEPRSIAVGLDLSARRADGSALPVTLGFASLDRDGETHLLVTVVDASDERGAETDLHRRTQTLEALHEATQDLLKTTDREAAAEAAVEYVEEVLDHSIAAIWLYDADRGLLEPVFWTVTADEVVGDHQTYTTEGRSISWEVFESGGLDGPRRHRIRTEHRRRGRGGARLDGRGHVRYGRRRAVRVPRDRSVKIRESDARNGGRDRPGRRAVSRPRSPGSPRRDRRRDRGPCRRRSSPESRSTPRAPRRTPRSRRRRGACRRRGRSRGRC
ncbi:hypothetical protein EKH57_13975 [Halorubrum sp. BOL3-1]|nr:hypothetical protein EKH57_13975 [Halorubrum sp. BOL3-1]